TTHFVPGEPWIYEVDTFWSSGAITHFTNAYPIPPIAVRTGQTYRTRVRHQGNDGRWSHWSSPIEFVATQPVLDLYLNGLVVSEVMYNPPLSQDHEYIEIKNVGAVPLDLTDVRFTKGIDFDFAGSAITGIDTGACVLVVRNLVAFEAHYGTGLPVAGEYRLNDENSLANGGERIKLSFGAGNAIREFTYDDRSPWPGEADGGGYSITLIAPGTLPDHTTPFNWRGSVMTNGSPGTNDVIHFIGMPDGDANTNGIPDLVDYALALRPEVTRVGTNIFFEYALNVGADDAVTARDISYDLAAWVTDPLNLTFKDRARLSGATERFRYRLASPLRAYFRLRFTDRP
ncbi:MAG: lamin tail domain-containing protein, partial [Verrucomicrobiota bacterium]